MPKACTGHVFGRLVGTRPRTFWDPLRRRYLIGPIYKNPRIAKSFGLSAWAGPVRQSRSAHLIRCGALWQEAAKAAKMAVFRGRQKHPKNGCFFGPLKSAIFVITSCREFSNTRRVIECQKIFKDQFLDVQLESIKNAVFGGLMESVENRQFDG